MYRHQPHINLPPPSLSQITEEKISDCSLQSPCLCGLTLTLSYSPEGSPATAVFRPHFLASVLSKHLLNFFTSSFMYLVVTFALRTADKFLAWKSGHKVPLLPIGPSCPPQAILLGDLVWCGSLLQVVMVVWRPFFHLKGDK